jgi:hypothetical protein
LTGLEEACADDVELRAEVEAMLATAGTWFQP